MSSLYIQCHLIHIASSGPCTLLVFPVWEFCHSSLPWPSVLSLPSGCDLLPAANVQTLGTTYDERKIIILVLIWDTVSELLHFILQQQSNLCSCLIITKSRAAYICMFYWYRAGCPSSFWRCRQKGPKESCPLPGINQMMVESESPVPGAGSLLGVLDPLSEGTTNRKVGYSRHIRYISSIE